MKVTALIPDQLVMEVRELASGETLTESLIHALREWTSLEKIKKLNREIAKHPFEFQDGFSAEKVRALNQRR